MQIAKVYFCTGIASGRSITGWLMSLITWIRSGSFIFHCSVAIDGLRLESVLSGDVLVYDRGGLPSTIVVVEVPLTKPVDILERVNKKPFKAWPTIWRAYFFGNVQAADNCLSRTCSLLMAGGAHQSIKNINTPAGLYRWLVKQGYKSCRTSK